MCLYRLKPSLAGAVTSTDRTDPISLRRVRLPRLALSRSVRFTNRFTRQANDLQFSRPLPPLHCCHLWVCGTMSGLAKRLARHGLDAGDASPEACPTSTTASWASVLIPGPARWHRPRRCPAQAPPPNPTAAGPDGRQVPAGVNTPTAGWGRPSAIPPACFLSPARISQPALSAWEVCGVADPLPADRLICGPIGDLSVVDRERPPALVRSGTWRARASMSRTRA
jgi:hypothetical protein